MTSLEFIARMNHPSSLFLQRTGCSSPSSGRIGLQCPQCGAESVIARALQIDSSLMCGECGAESEYRQMREAWCRERRDYLARACPEISFPSARQWA